MSQGYALVKGAIRCHQAVGITNITIAGSTLTAMTDMTLTFTLTQRKDVMCFFQAPFDADTTTATIYALFVDGVEVVRSIMHEKDDTSNDYFKSSSLIWLAEALEAGEHTILMKWSNNSGSTSYQPGGTYKRVLQALELGAEQENPIS